MPSSTRAGVILSPCPDLAPPVGVPSSCLASPGPDDSFAFHFAPLPASADSSCVALEGLSFRAKSAESTIADIEINDVELETQKDTIGELDNLEEMAAYSQDLSLMMKLQQLRQWQQHMQKQLKAHQLEELQRLQGEQQRLLTMLNKSHSDAAMFADSSEELSRSDCSEDTLHNSTQTTAGQQEGPLTQNTQRFLRAPSSYLSDEEGLCCSRVKEQSSEPLFSAQKRVHPDDSTQEETPLLDRPIKPGIGSQKRTFEQLLEEQLRLEEQRMKSERQQQSDPGSGAPQSRPKKAFLKRGEGLQRFTNQKAAFKKDLKPPPQTKSIIRSISEPASFPKTQTNPFPKVPVQRKTVVLNKEQRPKSSLPQESEAARLKVVQSHVRVTTPESDTEKNQPATPRACNFKDNYSEVRHQAVSRHVGQLQTTTPSRPACIHRQAQVQDSMELSFREWMQRWECERQVESMELGEFELLEQAAEELSFSSNSSFVIKVLQLDQQRRAAGLHPRRLSSTPIKSPPDTLQRCTQTADPGIQELSAAHSGPDPNLGAAHSGPDTDNATADSGPELDNKQEQCGSDMSSWGESELEDHHTDKQVPSVPSVLKFPIQSNPPYNKSTYQDEDSSKDTISEDADSETELSESEGCTVTEEQMRRVVFDDHDTWNELDQSVVISHHNGFKTTCRETPPECALTRKVAVTKAVEPEKQQQQDPSPTSQLMSRLFPALKKDSHNAPVSSLSAAGEPRTASQTTASQSQSQLLRERLVELELEIERFKKENAALSRLRNDNEKLQENLRKERSEFEQIKEQELARFEKYKREETRKLQKERKLFEKHQSAARAIPNKSEREEIQALKQQLSCLQEELRRKESRWSSTYSRLRQQLEAMGQDNTALREEIQALEKLRITSWKKNSDSGTKGVKFATPLDSSSSPPQSSLTASATRGSCRESAPGAALVPERKSSLRRQSLLGKKTEDTETQKDNQEQFNSSPEPRQSCAPAETQTAAANPEKDLDLPKEVVTHPDRKVEKVLSSGERHIVYPNGTKKEISADGLKVKVTFFNGDTKELAADRRVIYYYADAKTTHITYPDGMEVLHFPNNQTEKHFPDGRKEITFPDQTVKNLYPNGREESVLMDGTIIQVHPDGSKEIHFNTGQREVHTAEYKRREYPDGTVKTVYSDGRQETRYPTGRVRIKDKEGNVILDNGA